MARLVKMAEKRSEAIKDALSDEAKTEAIEFDWYGVHFETLARVPALVAHHIQVLMDDHTSTLQKSEALVYALKMIFIASDRSKFVKVLEEEGVPQDELLELFAFIYESIAKIPLDSSSSQSATSKTDLNNSEDGLY